MFEIVLERGCLVEVAEGEFHFEVKATHPYYKAATVEDALRHTPSTWNLAKMPEGIYLEASVEDVTEPHDWGRFKVMADAEDLKAFSALYQ